MYRVLFVCSGNICRSPTAEGVFQALAAAEGLGGAVGVDSAGIGDWHVGAPPDRRSQETARARGYDLSGQRARQVRDADFAEFDLILAMDSGHLRDLTDMCPPGADGRLRMFLDFAAGLEGGDVPDPYYGGADGFEAVLDMIEAGARGLLDHVRARFR